MGKVYISSFTNCLLDKRDNVLANKSFFVRNKQNSIIYQTAKVKLNNRWRRKSKNVLDLSTKYDFFTKKQFTKNWQQFLQIISVLLCYSQNFKESFPNKLGTI